MDLTNFKLMGKFLKERDLECHIYQGRIFGSEYIVLQDVSNYGLSGPVVGKDFAINVKQLSRLTEELARIEADLSTSGSPKDGQLRFFK